MSAALPALFLAVPQFPKLAALEERLSSCARALGAGGSAIPLLNADQISAIQSFGMLEGTFGENLFERVKGVYFGNDTCEQLIPSADEVLKALAFCREKKWEFAYVTPYVGPDAMDRLSRNFEALRSEAPGTEVVVNDFGVLRFLRTNYPELVPTLGRLFVKLKRDPRFSRTGFPISSENIEDLGNVQKNQSETLRNCSLDVPVYRDFLRKKGIVRVATDFVPSGVDHAGWGFPTDAYWPWIYVMSGRACMVAAQTQPGKAKHPTDEPCRRQCQEYELQIDGEAYGAYDTVQRGNAVWMNGTGLFDHVLAGGFGRLVYEPFIPV